MTETSARSTILAARPDLISQWHPKKNGTLSPGSLLSGSSKKVWWICPKKHEWQAIVANRIKKGSGCPYCAGQRAYGRNCLAELNPMLAAEWHPVKNEAITPKDVLLNAHKNVWWLCKNKHEWRQRVDARTHSPECPYCSKSRPTEEYSLQAVNKKLSSEWHPIKNGILKPRDFLPNTHKRVWWLCKKGHEWIASIDQRNYKNSGCPRCFSQTSFPELLIYSEMKHLFPKTEHRKKHFGVECDIYIPEIEVAIEVDGRYWHKGKESADTAKTKILTDAGIFVIRLREKGLTKVSKYEVNYVSSKLGFDIVKEVIELILKNKKICTKEKYILQTYFQKGNFINQAELMMLMDMLPSPLPGRSLYDKNRAIAKEWHPTKNGTLTPKDVSPDTKSKIWWICKRGHEWQAMVTNRHKGNGCPYCGGSMPTLENCLQALNPDLSSEWHPTKNGTLTPRDVLPNTRKCLAWWRCQKGHEWQALVNARMSGTGCPLCSGRVLRADNNLLAVNPELAKQWHPIKNGSLTPQDVFSSGANKVWWLCREKHEWQATVNSRSFHKSGCPYCSGRYASAESCLHMVNPALSREWHPSKNESLTPRDVRPNSNKKVWWICKSGHEWQATPSTRNKGHGCRRCSNFRRSKRLPIKRNDVPMYRNGTR